MELSKYRLGELIEQCDELIDQRMVYLGFFRIAGFLWNSMVGADVHGEVRGA